MDSFAEYLVTRWWNYLGRLKRCGFVGEGVSLGAGFPVCHFLYFLFVDGDVSSQLLLQRRVCLPITVLPTMMGMDFHPSGTLIPK